MKNRGNKQQISNLGRQNHGNHPIRKAKRKKHFKNNSLRDFWDNIICTGIRIIGIPEGESLLEEIMTEN